MGFKVGIKVIELAHSIFSLRDLAIKPWEIALLNFLVLKSAFCNTNKMQNVLSNDRVFMLHLQQQVTLIALAAIAIYCQTKQIQTNLDGL